MLTPAGLEKSVGLITVAYLKDAVDTQWANDPGMKDFVAFMAKYVPDGKLADSNNVYGYSAAQTLVRVLKQCGNDLTRANIMRQAANLRICNCRLRCRVSRSNTSPTDFYPVRSLQLQRFDGKQWVLYGNANQ